MGEDDESSNVMRDDNMQLLKSLLSILTSCSLIFEQVARQKQKYSSMSMVLTLCSIIADCLCDDTLKALMSDYLSYLNKQNDKRKKLTNKRKQQQAKMNDLRLFVSKSLMSLFKVFPIEFVRETEDEYADKQMDVDEEAKDKKEAMDRVFIIRMNMKMINICHQFVDYWKLNLLKETDGRRKAMNYFDICYKWLHASLTQLTLDDSQSVIVNRKIMIDLLQILKRMIGLFDENKQMQLLICVQSLVQNEALMKDTKVSFGQLMN